MKLNVGVCFVPTQESFVIERFGKYHKILDSGLNLIIPFIDQVAYIQLLKEQAIQIDSQSAITSDNVVLQINGVLYIKVIDPYKASYGVDDPEEAITQLAKTTMRANIGGMTLDTVFKERDALNARIVESLNSASEEPWGVKCLRYEIKDIDVPESIRRSMEKEVEAERTKRATILESEADRQAAINRAEGEREAIVRRAKAEAEAIEAIAEATAKRVQVIGNALSSESGKEAAALSVAERYVDAFGQVAKESTNLVLPMNAGDIASTVGTAMSVYNNINKGQVSAKDVENVLNDDLEKIKNQFS